MLGGAFNPPHIGHLVLAQEAASQLGLQRVVLMPTGRAPHKRIDPEPGREIRLEMTRRAAAGDELLEVCDHEVRADGPSYTARTLEWFRERRPGEEICLLMGADAAAYLEAWHEPRRVLELARIGIAGRPGTVLDQAEAAVERLGGAGRALTVRMPAIEVSSSTIRRRIAQGKPIRYLVPEPVREMIVADGLYREAVTA